MCALSSVGRSGLNLFYRDRERSSLTVLSSYFAQSHFVLWQWTRWNRRKCWPTDVNTGDYLLIFNSEKNFVCCPTQGCSPLVYIVFFGGGEHGSLVSAAMILAFPSSFPTITLWLSALVVRVCLCACVRAYVCDLFCQNKVLPKLQPYRQNWGWFSI